MDWNLPNSLTLNGKIMENENLKIVYGYSYFPSDAYGDLEKMSLDYVDRLNKSASDYTVSGFCVTLNPPNYALSFPELDQLWKRRDPELLKLYDRLEEFLGDKDVLLNASGINLHPEFVEKLKVFKVFQCFDDPENSDNLSKPAAHAYDLSLVGNIAEVSTYKSWGIKNVEWVPMGVLPEIYNPELTEEQIRSSKRDIDLLMMIDKTSPYRIERLDALDNAFPEAHFYGKGWKRGYLPVDQQLEFLQRSKIGPNIHNSTGPINYRTFYLPANGVMQVCDNKSHLGKIFELDKEVVGFDTIEECIDKCRYYLAHEDERLEIAIKGWKRCLKDYTEVAIFERSVELFNKYIELKPQREGFFRPLSKIIRNFIK
jgi:hypothetical protein